MDKLYSFKEFVNNFEIFLPFNNKVVLDWK